MYIFQQIYEEPRESEKGDGWVVSNCSPRGVKGDPYSVRENYDSLFRASPPTIDSCALSGRTMPSNSPTPLREIIDVKITGKDERVYCFAVEHAD